MIILKGESRKKKILILLRKIIPSNWLDYVLFVYMNKYLPSLNKPRTFNEHIFYIKRNVQDIRMIKLCDKYEVRDFVSQAIGEKYLPKLICASEKWDESIFESIGNNFAMKPSLGSGYYYLNVDENSNKEEVKELFSNWINLDYWKVGGEWQYKYSQQKIIFESLLFDDNKKLANDYKVHCFRNSLGQFKQVIEVHDDRFGEHSQMFFDENLSQLSIEKKNKRENYTFPEDFPLDDLLVLSRKLSEGFGYVRVDWYCCSGRLFFGEMTFTPGNAVSPFKKKDYDTFLGNYLN